MFKKLIAKGHGARMRADAEREIMRMSEKAQAYNDSTGDTNIYYADGLFFILETFDNKTVTELTFEELQQHFELMNDALTEGE